MTTVRMWSGRESRALREALRMGTREFAARLGISERTVTKWEAGGNHVHPHPENQAALDTALRQASDEATSRFEAALRDRRGSEGTAPAHRVRDRDTPTGASERATCTAPNTEHEHLTGQELVLVAAEESAAYARRHGGSNVHAMNIEQFEADVRGLAADFMSGPPIAVVQRARGLRDQTFDLLDGRQWPHQTRELLSLAGRLCGLLAVASSDFFGRYDAAATQCRTAWLCAEMAEHDDLRSWIRSLQSGIALWAGRYGDAVALARHATEHARTASSAARAAVLEARALARLDDVAGVRRAVAASEATGGLPEDVDAVGVMGFPEANRMRCAGTAYLWLGQYPAAARELESALASYEREDLPAYAHVAVTRVDLAAARLLGGDLAGAADALGPVLATPQDRRLAGVARRASNLRTLLSKPEYRASPAAHDLGNRIDSLRACLMWRLWRVSCSR